MVKYINIVLSLDAKPVKLPDEIMLLDLACVWTGHGKQVLMAVVLIFFIVVGNVADDVEENVGGHDVDENVRISPSN